MSYVNTAAPALQVNLDVRERILAAAETLFAQKGVERTSIREITAEAGVNVASINYYFRSKDTLAEEIFARLAERATTRRLAELSAYKQTAAERGEALGLETLIGCFIKPYFERGINGPLFARLVLQHRLQPCEMTQRVYDRYLDPFATEFIDALSLTDRRVPRSEWVWRYTLMTGTVMMSVTDTNAANRLLALSGGDADAARSDELQCNLMHFLCAALRSSK